MEIITDYLTLLVRMAHLTDEEVICNVQQPGVCACGRAARDERVRKYLVDYTEAIQLPSDFCVFPTHMHYLARMTDLSRLAPPGVFCLGCAVIATADKSDHTHYFLRGAPSEPIRIQR